MVSVKHENKKKFGTIKKIYNKENCEKGLIL